MDRELPADAQTLLDAVLAIGSDLDLDGVLSRIVESACAITRAQYGVLATVGESGGFDQLIQRGFSDEVIARIGRAPVGRGLLGAVPRQRRTLRVEHVSDHPESVGYPEGHPAIDRFLGAPVPVGGEAFGHLYLGKEADSGPFTDGDQALVEALARVAGVLIQNARSFEESERRRAWLDASVRISTALAPTVDPDDAARLLVGDVLEVSGARTVALVYSDRGVVEVAASAGDVPPVSALGEELGATIAKVGDSGESMRFVHGDGTVSVLVPMRTELARSGVLLVLGVGSDGREEGLMGAFADQLGIALDRAEAIRERHELLLFKDRDRIARDLHDLVIQRILATGLRLRASKDLRDADRDEVLDQAVAELDRAIGDLRTTIFELGRGGLASLLDRVRDLIRDYTPVLGFVPVLRTTGPVERALEPPAAEQVLIVLREALSNIARHARASAASVELAASSAWFTVRVTDDGGGLAPDQLSTGHGLANLRHRAEELGGHSELRPAPDRGTVLEWVVPAIA